MSAVLRNLDAELGVLGALIFEPALLERLSDLTADHFAEPFHQRIFAEIVLRVRAGGIAEPTSLAARFSNDLAAKGDPKDPDWNLKGFFDDLLDKAPTDRVAEAMAQTIIDASQRRQLIEMAGRMRDAATNPEAVTFDTLTLAERDISGMVQSTAPDSATLVSAVDAASQTLDRILTDKRDGKARGAMTGLACFDKRLRGLQPGRLHIIAGRPSMGKTSLARAAALGCARLNPDKTVVYFCLEMDREEMSLRTLSQITRETGRPIPYFRMEGDSLSDDQIRQLDECRQHIPTNFVLDDSSSLSIEHVERRLYSLAKKGPIAAAFIDYLQIMDMARGFNANRAEAVGDITGRLKRLAKRLGLGMVALSQLSRKVEERDSKRPLLSDLRDSGSIEQDANVVLFPFRESYYLERMDAPKGMDARVWEAKIETAKNKMEVICAKQRGGPIGSDMQRYLAAYDFLSDPEDDGLRPQPTGAWSDDAMGSFV
jgi:replicative DNA helicase